MFATTRFEITKMVAQKRSLMGFLTIVLINTLFTIAFLLRTSRHGTALVRELRGQERLWVEFMNAYQFTHAILAPCTFMLFPMVLSIMGAHILAGEMELGNIRMMACRSVNRWEIVLAKFTTMCLYCAALLGVLLVLSYGVSAIVFKSTGDVIVMGRLMMMKKAVIVHAADSAVPRILLSYLLALPMLMSVSAMALMFSMVTRHFTSASILTSTVYFCSYIVGGIPFLSTIHPFLPTRYLPFWRFVFLETIPWSKIISHGGWTFGYTAGFLGLAIAIFNMRDL